MIDLRVIFFCLRPSVRVRFPSTPHRSPPLIYNFRDIPRQIIIESYTSYIVLRIRYGLIYHPYIQTGHSKVSMKIWVWDFPGMEVADRPCLGPQSPRGEGSIRTKETRGDV